MLVPQGLCLAFKNEILFRPAISESRRRLPNRDDGDEKKPINRTDSGPPTIDWPPQLAPAISGDTQIIGATTATLSEQLSSPERKDTADLEDSPLLSVSATDMGGTPTSRNRRAESFPPRPLNDFVTQFKSPLTMTIPYETSSASHKMNAEPSAVDARCKGSSPSSSTTAKGLPRTRTSSNLNIASPAVPSTKEITYPPVNSQPTEVVSRTNPTDERSAIGPNGSRSFNVRRKPPPPLSSLAKSMPISIIAGQSSSGACGGSPQSMASCSLAYKGVSTPSLPPSMDQKVEPFLGDENYPFPASQPRSVATTSGDSSYLTTAFPTPQSLFPDCPSPPPIRTSRRLAVKSLLPKPSLPSHPNSRKLVKMSSRGPRGSSVDRNKCEPGKTLADQIGSSDCPGIRVDSGHHVYSQPSYSSILPATNEVLRSNGVVLSKEHRSSILTDDMLPPRAQPDVRAFPLVSTICTSPHGVSEKGERGEGERRLSPLFEGDSKMDNTKDIDNKPAGRRRNVLQKRRHHGTIGVSQSTSTLGNSRSSSHRDGCEFAASHFGEHEDLVHRNRRPHDSDRISISQPQSVAVPGHSTRLSTGSPATSQLHKRTTEQGFSLEASRKIRQEAIGNVERLTPVASMGVETPEGSRNRNQSYVVTDPQRRGKPEGSTSMQGRRLLQSASMSDILLSDPELLDRQVQNPEMTRHERYKLRDRARQSLNISIADSNQLGDENFRKSTDGVSSKASGGRLRKLMRKFSLSRCGDKRDDHPPAVPIWSISTPMFFPLVATQLSDDQIPSRSKAESVRSPIFGPDIGSSASRATPRSSPADEIPPLPKHPVSLPLDLRIVNPSVLDQACHDEEDRSRILQNQSVLPTSTPKMPAEGEWTRTNSPDLELAALPLPPRRARKMSTGLPSQSGIGTDDADLTHPGSPMTFSQSSESLNLRQSRSPTSAMDLQSDPPNLTSSGFVIPAISLSPPPHRPMTNAQRPNRKRLFIGDIHPRSNKTPPLQRTPSLQGYSSEVRNTSPNYTIAQPMPSVLNSTSIGVEDRPVRAEEMDSNAYLTFTRSSMIATPSVVFRPGTANTFGGAETLGSNIRPGTSDSVRSAISTSIERGQVY